MLSPHLIYEFLTFQDIIIRLIAIIVKLMFN